VAYPNEQPAGPSQPFEGPAPAGWRQWFQLQGRPRPWRRTLAAGAGAAVAIIVLGVLLGLLWSWLAPTVPVIKLTDGSIVVTDPAPEQYIAADGWFTLLGLGFGLIVTIGSWLVLRRDRGPFLLLGIVGGAFVAGRWVAPAVGEFLGRDAYREWREVAAQGATYLAPPELQSLGPKLVPAFIAAVVLTLLAGWSNDPDLDHPGAQPGYGPNHAHPPYGSDYAPYGGDHSPYAHPAGAGDAVSYERPGTDPGQPHGDGVSYERPGTGPDQTYGDVVSYERPGAAQAHTNGGAVAHERPETGPAQPFDGAGQPQEPRHPA
jgi:hypothetical protein